jgi:hypothetical protein
VGVLWLFAVSLVLFATHANTKCAKFDGKHPHVNKTFSVHHFTGACTTADFSMFFFILNLTESLSQTPKGVV